MALRAMFRLRIRWKRALSPCSLDKVTLFSSGKNSWMDRLKRNSFKRCAGLRRLPNSSTMRSSVRGVAEVAPLPTAFQ